MDRGLEIHCGDCLDILPTLPAQSVQCCVTSPPYWGLRDYDTAQWEGGDAGCDHVVSNANNRLMLGSDGTLGKNCTSWTHRDASTVTRDCPRCGARRIDSQLGLETTPEEYIEKMVAVFRAVWRVLRDDGTLWVNMGDCYFSEGVKIHGGFNGSTPEPQRIKGQNLGGDTAKHPYLRSKQLCMMPARLAMALQADGWYLRSEIVWHKPNPMPESVTDRPTKAHEMIYLLAKQERYFYDAEAIREPAAEDRFKKRPNGWPYNPDNKLAESGSGIKHNHSFAAACTELLDYRNKRSVWTIATQPYAEAHFATFPEEIPKLCILAGSKPGDTVLDPFAGSGTVGKVALEIGRKAILIELSPEYIRLIKVYTAVTVGWF